jgi:PIN domain nuclease of toxin-antitoxin system
LNRRLLLDTQAFLDFRAGSRRISARARKAFLDPAAELVVSAVSVWEMGIKSALGKLDLAVSLRDVMETALATGHIRFLGVSLEHLYAVESLPWHHRDPFDRLLVCQARVEGLAILGSDGAFDAYDVERIW